MEKLKKFKNEHDHLLTKLLKVFLFSCIMIAPLIAGLSQWMYVVYNKNANQNYSGTSENVATYITKNSDFEVGQNYYFNAKNYTNLVGLSVGNTQRIFVSNIDNIYTNLSVSTVQQIRSIGLYKESNTNFFYIYAYDENGSTLLNGVGTNNNNLAFTFDFVSSTLSNSIYTYSNIFYKINTYYNGYMDNAFYYGMEKMADSELFGWTKNTGIYTTINSMATGLGVNESNNILAVILTYWALMTAIYIIFDIIIELFIKITHFLA